MVWNVITSGWRQGRAIRKNKKNKRREHRSRTFYLLVVILKMEKALRQNDEMEGI